MSCAEAASSMSAQHSLAWTQMLHKRRLHRVQERVHGNWLHGVARREISHVSAATPHA